MKTLGVVFTALISAVAGAAAAIYAVKKREELEQYDYDFDDEDEIYFDDDDECDCCCSCGEKDEEPVASEDVTAEEAAADADDDIADLQKLDGADEEDITE